MLPNDTVYINDDDTTFDRECPQCGKDTLTTRWHHDTFKYGTGDSAVTLEVDLPVRRCVSCDLQFLDHDGERLRHEAVCRHLGLLSPTEISGIRKTYGMSRAAFADLTGLGEATLSRWENGAGIQNPANDRYLRLLSLRGVMVSLRDLTTSKRVSEPEFLNQPRFRVLIESEEQRNRQKDFQLRLAG